MHGKRGEIIKIRSFLSLFAFFLYLKRDGRNRKEKDPHVDASRTVTC